MALKNSYIDFKNDSHLTSIRRVSATKPKGAKNLVKVESRIEKRAAGATTHAKQDSATIKGKIVEFIVWMTNQGYRESTVKSRYKKMRQLHRLGCNLLDPETVKKVIASQSWAESTKANFADTYDSFTRYIGISWEKPKYRYETQRLPFIPTEAEIDQLIASCGKKTATFLQFLKETAMRPGEAEMLQWTDVDVEHKVVYVTPEKRSNPRILPISDKLISMLARLPKKSKRIFAGLLGMRCTFVKQRKRAADKLCNPRLLQIHFHTLRHWKATIEYHKTKDIIYVKELLGHKNIKNTMIYITIEKSIFKTSPNDEYITRVGVSIRGARALLQAGFEYVTDMDGCKLFRKRK